jgi:hypothetical protein
MKTFKRWFIPVSIIILSALAVMAFVMPSRNPNSYNPITGIINCNSPTMCLHENGHLLDKNLGFP